MYAAASVKRPPEGLGFAPWIVPLIVGIATSAGSALVTKAIAGPSGPGQKEREEELKRQQQAEIQRQHIQQQQIAQVGSYLVPAAVIVGLVLLLR